MNHQNDQRHENYFKRLRLSPFIPLIFTIFLLILPQDLACGQRNRANDKPDQSSTDKQKENQDNSKTSQKPALKATAIVHLRDGKKLAAANVQTQRNGDLKLTLLDGSTTTIEKKDVAKVEESVDNEGQKKSNSQTRNSRRSSPNGDDNSSQSNATKNNSSKQQTGRTSSDRSRPAEKEPMPGRDAAKLQPKKTATIFTIQMSDGQQISGVSLKQLNRKSWQVTTSTDTKMTIDIAKIGSITDRVGGQKLKPTIGRNGEVILVLDNGEESSNAPQPAPEGIGSTSMYDTLSDSANSIEKSAVRQSFLASCNDLKSVLVKLEGEYDVEVRVINDETGSVLGSRTVSVPGNGSTLISFSPALSLTPGNPYRIEVERTGSAGKLKAFVTENDEYVFSKVELGSNWSSMSGNSEQNDLVMRVRGNSPVNLPASNPNQKALLVLLENDGIVGSLGAAGIDYPDLPEVPFMVYTGNEREIEFKLNKNESVVQALARLGSELEAIALDEVGPAPKPPQVNNGLGGSVSNPLDPNYLEKKSEHTAKLVALTAKLLNFNNWEIRTESADEFIGTVSDLVIEEFTRSYILQKTQSKYDQVVVIEDTQFEASSVLSALEQLASNYVVDIHVLSHGSVDKIIGHTTGGTSHNLTRSNFFIPLRQAQLRGTPLRIRTVYQCICTGGSLKREWQALGAAAVNGTRGEVSGEAKKNYMPQQYIHFLDYWCNQDKSFGQATALSFMAASNYSKSVYSALSEKPDLIEDSELTVAGDGSIKRNP